ncbi:MAG TPA: sigma-54 dependent transcriptional regulator [Syntrophomonas sp.]|nr:sigma-54 dependent transcriptional regulator [Syntrophomonas sp.]
MNKKKVLIVDDETLVRQFLHEVLAEEGFSVFEAADGGDALNTLMTNPMDVVIMDLRMPGMDGIETLKEINKRKIPTKVIIMTGYATIRTAVDTIKLGAFNYIAKPFENDDLVAMVKEAVVSPQAPAFNNAYEAEPEESNLSGIIGRSPAMNEIFKMIQKVAAHNTTVLITGESGTGKSLLAQVIHDASSRKNAPFITINCATLPENLLESELFGHEKGAFTGAVSAQTGKFELAKNGTIFLDEISTLSANTQAKLLRVIQDKKFERVGGERTLEVDVRIIAATNERLDLAVKEGRFREDLFYRLNVITVEMPPLRDRAEDIPLLVYFFINRFHEKLGVNISSVSSEAMDLLIRYKWPGNIRELENVIERAMILEDDAEIGIDCLPAHIRLIKRESHRNASAEEDPLGLKLDKAVDQAEKELMLEVLEKTNGHRAKAAEILGISRRTLQYKLKKYGIV